MSCSLRPYSWTLDWTFRCLNLFWTSKNTKTAFFFVWMNKEIWSFIMTPNYILADGFKMLNKDGDSKKTKNMLIRVNIIKIKSKAWASLKWWKLKKQDKWANLANNMVWFIILETGLLIYVMEKEYKFSLLQITWLSILVIGPKIKNVDKESSQFIAKSRSK